MAAVQLPQCQPLPTISVAVVTVNDCDGVRRRGRALRQFHILASGDSGGGGEAQVEVAATAAAAVVAVAIAIAAGKKDD